MRLLHYLVLLPSLLLAFSSCTSSQDYVAQFANEEGISYELAQLRHRTISNVRYELSFHIPAEKDSAIQCEEILRFQLDSLYNIPLDFWMDISFFQPIH